MDKIAHLLTNLKSLISYFFRFRIERLKKNFKMIETQICTKPHPPKYIKCVNTTNHLSLIKKSITLHLKGMIRYSTEQRNFKSYYTSFMAFYIFSLKEALISDALGGSTGKSSTAIIQFKTSQLLSYLL